MITTYDKIFSELLWDVDLRGNFYDGSRYYIYGSKRCPLAIKAEDPKEALSIFYEYKQSVIMPYMKGLRHNGRLIIRRSERCGYDVGRVEPSRIISGPYIDSVGIIKYCNSMSRLDLLKFVIDL